MSATEKQLLQWLSRYLTEEDIDLNKHPELRDWADADIDRQIFLSQIINEEFLASEIMLYKSIDPARGFSRWRNARKDRSGVHFTWRVAGALAVAAAVTWLFVRLPVSIESHRIPSEQLAEIPGSGIMPGGDRAVLTLADGRRIDLDNSSKDSSLKELGAGSLTLRKGELDYEQEHGPSKVAIAYNVLTTPRSGQYRLTLSDGTRVWVNNASSLNYPVIFGEHERRVTLTGEAYFEVSPDASKPFIVEVNHTAVKVLGTSFAITAYPDEPTIHATLVTGAVSVATSTGPVVLQPDQQLQLDSNGRSLGLRNVQAADIVSWKDGYFSFEEGTTFEEVMRRLGRWYDLDIEYAGAIPNQRFTGRIERSLPLQAILKYLNVDSHIRYRMEGRTLVILPS